MRLFLIIGLSAVALFARCALANDDNETKRGGFPFMAFVYYLDPNIIDRTGGRLVRGAVLIRKDWLISSSLEDGDTSMSFPKKTLVARLGAIRIDSRFTLNEDEDEQEREIVQIARPHNYSATEWWVADISLLKTVLPFNITSVVSPSAINAKPNAADKNCFILIYLAPNGNKSEDRMLMELSVDMLPSTPENCGSNFVKNTMICSADGDDLKKDTNFCEGNSGGPLICENDVVGIQTYIKDCKPPHLYQYLISWDNLITCALEDKCQEEQCATICNIINKDPNETTSQRTLLVEAKMYTDGNVNNSNGDILLTTTTISSRLLSDPSQTVSDIDLNNETNNIETTTTSSTVVNISEREIEVSEVELIKPTPTLNTEEEKEISTATSYIISESDTTQYVYKTEELVNKVEELKNLIDENTISDNIQTKVEQHRVRSSASVNIQSPCNFVFALMLYYLQLI